MKTKTGPDRSAFMVNLPLFAGLGNDTMERIEGTWRHKLLSKGDYLFLQSDEADAFYLVYSGEIELALSSADGRELLINRMRPGDCFGELALLTGEPRSASAMARVDSEGWVMPGPVFLALLDSEPRLARNLLEMVSRRLQSSSERESALAFLDAQSRVARLLLQLDEAAQEKGYIIISQEELAQHTGLTRQTVAKILGRWRRAGWLVTGRGRIVLFNRAKLARISAEAETF
jgi:CRP/FNR family transcriptional regulator, cyclic AMP receptor protein